MTTQAPETMRQFRLLAADRSADEMEREMLARWRDERLFERTLAEREGAPRWVFFEGPPTANGRPGIHHVFSRTLKDLFCRHRVMTGHLVERKAGWDTHGLPVEIEVEKEIARRIQAERGLSDEELKRITGKQLIEEIGVAEFNRMCRESVFRYREDWERLSERIAYWLDYGDPYVTLSHDYVESVWWALKTLHARGLLYKGHKILPYCARCGTALSSHEVAQGYEEVRDPSVFLALDLEEVGGSAVQRVDVDGSPRSARRILVWTTTPWTLLSNVALAVHPELDYVELVRRDGRDPRTILVAAARAGAVLGEDFTDRWETVRHLRGADLVGARYRRPLDWLPYGAGAHEVIVGESFVSAEDGTGVVHMAPAFGADDYTAGQRHGLDFLQPVNAQGAFPADVPLVGGMFVKDADPRIVEELKRRGVLWKAGTIEHSYPHCWRCGTPLLYYARSSWFVRTTAVRDAMLVRNARVDWHPEAVGQRRFGEWLTNNIDWAISRDRYWGTPLPVWSCDVDPSHLDVVGAYAELAARMGGALSADFDPHKPHVDGYAWRCREAGCAGTMRRVPEVIDTWFDSGSMPFAQWHFPFENRERVAEQYPADWICEGVDQTRGWFYSLLAIATGLGDELPNNRVPDADVRTAPYRAVVVNDLVLDAEGQKMSKSRGNTVDPWTVLERHGADAVRLFLVETSQVWIPRRFDEAAIRERAGRFLVTLKNVYSGIFAQYANFGWAPSPDDPPGAHRPTIDRWMLSRLTAVEHDADALLERFEATQAAGMVMDFFVDEVSNWYVRLNRSRFYDTDGADNRAAFATLHEVLVVTCRLLAPFAPFVTDWLHRELAGTSVHLAPYVRPTRDPRDHELERAMAQLRELARLGRAAREAAGIRVRQALGRMVCVVPDTGGPQLGSLLPLLEGELNVRRVELATSADALVTLEAKPNFRSLGKKFGKSTPLAAQAVAVLSSETLRAFERGEPIAISVGNESRSLDPEDVTIVRRASGDFVVEESAGFFAAIDPTITPELRAEGLARELISRVQRLRKEAGLAVSDRIVLTVAGAETVRDMVKTHREWIATEVLAREVVVADELPDHHLAAQSVDLDEGITARIALTRAG
ncbi:MAG TPA: isoleucine--tRNA ligase [Gemmatimonadaceae bacterium]